MCDDALTKDEQCNNDCAKYCKEMNIWRVSLWNKIRCDGEKLMYAYGSFENAERVILIGFVYKTKRELVRKIKKAKYDGWHYDGVYCPLIQCDVLPSYIDRRY